MPDSHKSEYGEVVRVHASNEHEVAYLAGYAFVPESQALHIRQYCREMTLSRGRILYAVWDDWTNHFLGSIVPDDVLREARALRKGSALTPWPDEVFEVRSVLHRVHNLLMERFPRIPTYSARMITEAVYRHLRGRPCTHGAVEAAVIEHIKWYYTSLEFRVQEMGEKEKAVLEAVKPRMREVLESWVPHYTHSNDLVELWERHDLLGGGREDEEQKLFEKKLFRAGTLAHYGGMEMTGNIVTSMHTML